VKHLTQVTTKKTSQSSSSKSNPRMKLQQIKLSNQVITNQTLQSSYTPYQTFQSRCDKSNLRLKLANNHLSGEYFFFYVVIYHLHLLMVCMHISQLIRYARASSIYRTFQSEANYCLCMIITNLV
jgi:hypothetical protein